jgi:antitoxin (DNA-binding transcriptional repressor) of toxin-antitoxin stability system
MRAVGIKALKNKLSEYVRLAAGGETVLVTDRDAVVAELGPPRAGRAEAVGDAVLADAVRRGWITPPVAAGEAPPAPPVVSAAVSLAKVLAELRADRDAR